MSDKSGWIYFLSGVYHPGYNILCTRVATDSTKLGTCRISTNKTLEKHEIWLKDKNFVETYVIFSLLEDIVQFVSTQIMYIVNLISA